MSAACQLRVICRMLRSGSTTILSSTYGASVLVTTLICRECTSHILRISVEVDAKASPDAEGPQLAPIFSVLILVPLTQRLFSSAVTLPIFFGGHARARPAWVVVVVVASPTLVCQDQRPQRLLQKGTAEWGEGSAGHRAWRSRCLFLWSALLPLSHHNLAIQLPPGRQGPPAANSESFPVCRGLPPMISEELGSDAPKTGTVQTSSPLVPKDP